MNEPFSTRLLAALNTFYEGVMGFLPGLLAFLLIALLGLALAWVVRAVVRRVLTAARFDRLADSSGAGQLLIRADIRATPSALVASFLFWVLLASFAMAGLSALDVEAIDLLTAEFFLYLPQIFAGLVILLVGFLFANFLSRATLLAAINAGAPSPRVISLVVKLLITVLAFAMALEQLHIARSIVLAAFIISFGAVMLSVAIAFGIGGHEVARRILERRFEADDHRDDLEHL
jgi:hypothetical protein